MNFLAHLYLSGDSENIRVCNYIGDYVKVKNYEKYTEEIKYGILLHRKIDAFTDSNSIVRLSKNHFIEKYHKYAGVITDIIYDHFLTSLWDNYSKTPLKNFIYYSYEVLLNNYNLLPIRVKQFLPHFVIYNWLESYSSIEGLARVFKRMSIRTSLPEETDYAIKELKTNYLKLKKEFDHFFPLLIEHVKEDKIVKIA